MRVTARAMWPRRWWVNRSVLRRSWPKLENQELVRSTGVGVIGGDRSDRLGVQAGARLSWRVLQYDRCGGYGQQHRADVRADRRPRGAQQVGRQKVDCVGAIGYRFHRSPHRHDRRVVLNRDDGGDVDTAAGLIEQPASQQLAFIGGELMELGSKAREHDTGNASS